LDVEPNPPLFISGQSKAVGHSSKTLKVVSVFKNKFEFLNYVPMKPA
jgi:hypothetical protein